MKIGVPYGFCTQCPCARAVARNGLLQVAPIHIRFERLTFFKLPALLEVMTFSGKDQNTVIFREKYRKYPIWVPIVAMQNKKRDIVAQISKCGFRDFHFSRM
jgi:hypothetical protein